MLAANLPVCQYAGMPGQSNSAAATNHSNHNNNNNGNNSTNNSNISNNNTITTNSSNCHNNTNNSCSSNNTNAIGSANHTNTINNNTSNGNISTSNSGNNGDGNIHVGLVGGGTSAAAAKNQLEQLNTMREALFSQDGWGCQHVNQDTNWEVPSSPEPSNKDATGPPLWKPTINNGTDLWESNLRTGGQPPTQAVQKPWGHTPSTNLGGTWGEDDDGAEVGNVWAGGGPSSNNPQSMCVPVGVTGVAATTVAVPPNAAQWGQANVGGGLGVGVGVNTVQANVTASSGNMCSVTPGNSNATGINVPVTPNMNAGATSNGWGDPRDIRTGPIGTPLDIRNVDPRDALRASSAGDPREIRVLDPRDPIRGDPRGISGRLNGTSEMWVQHHPIGHNQMPNMNKMGSAVGNATVAVVAGSGNVPAIGGGPGSVGSLNPPGSVASNIVGSQWGIAQSVVGPKDMTSISTKPSGSGWEEPSPPPQRRNIPNYDDGTSLWGQQSRIPGGTSHWKDVSDPRSHHIRGGAISGSVGQNMATNPAVMTGLNITAGGASGNTSGVGLIPSVVPTGNPNNPMSLGPPGARLITNVGGTSSSVNVNVVGGNTAHKADNIVWTHSGGQNLPNVISGRNVAGTWGSDDNSHNVVIGSASHSSNWTTEDKANAQATSAGIGQIGATVANLNTWNDPPNGTWNKAQPNKLSGAGGWSVSSGTTTASNNDVNDINPVDWGNGSITHNNIIGKVQQTKLGSNVVSMSALSQELKQSKQFRILVEAGFKKDDVERALLNSNMNIEEATELLRSNITTIGMDNWRRHDETISSFADPTSTTACNNFAGRYTNQTTQPIMAFPPNNIINTMSGGSMGVGGSNNANVNALNSMQSMQVQKYLTQGGGPHGVSGGAPQPVNGPPSLGFSQSPNVSAVSAAVGTNNTNQPSTQQLRMLVQQIQLAVHNGYLSSQILNQPLAPATLLLLNQLLSNIKHLQGAQQSLRGSSNANTMVAIAKYKQQIQNLQNQINAQQTIYIKQQQQQQQQNLQQAQQQQHPPTHISSSNTDYLRSHDAIIAIHNNFSEMSLNKSGGSAGFQGTPNPQSRLNQWKLPTLDKDINADSTDFSRAPGTSKQPGIPTNSSNMVPLGIQNDGTWSTTRSINDGWPETSTDSESKDWSVGHPSTSAAYTDLVQEFEPGKPWKGPQIKTIEDDPSITPGSVARSPLSINSATKDAADIFANATGKPVPSEIPSLGLTTSSTWSFNPTSSNQNFPSWSDNSQQELWTSANKSSRGPPPGLAANKPVGAIASVSNSSTIVGGNVNGWLNTRTATGWSGTNTNWNSNWLLLKNLTTQIDSSTLRTLCMQHGPLLRFHLYLNQGIALCKYATREEASKAQMTLNSCFLGNTTICAESPSENEVDSLLHHLPQSSQIMTSLSGQTNNSIGGNNNSGHTDSSSGNIIGGVNGSGSSINNTNSAAASVVNGTANIVTTCNNQTSPGQSQLSGNSGGSNAASIASNCGSCVPTNASHQTNLNMGSSNTASGNNNPNSAWRQQLQNSTNQNRPSGRDDFEFISQYVCSIVDD